jgi:putative membrane protein
MEAIYGVGLHEWWPVAGPLLAVWILFRIAVWGLLIAGLVLAIRWLRRGGCGRWRQTSLEVLKLRYARGDITREDFEAMKRDVGGA